MLKNDPQPQQSAKNKIGQPFILIMVGFIMMPIVTYFYLQPKPEVGGFDALEALRAEERLQIRQQVEKEALADLGLEPGNEYAWVDKSVGTVRIPIDEAIEKTAEMLTSKPIRESDYVDLVTANALGITPHPSVLSANAAPQAQTQAPLADTAADANGNQSAEQPAADSAQNTQSP